MPQSASAIFGRVVQEFEALPIIGAQVGSGTINLTTAYTTNVISLNVTIPGNASVRVTSLFFFEVTDNTCLGDVEMVRPDGSTGMLGPVVEFGVAGHLGRSVVPLINTFSVNSTVGNPAGALASGTYTFRMLARKDVTLNQGDWRRSQSMLTVEVF